MSDLPRRQQAARPVRNYVHLLDQIHCHLLPRTYLEIGVSEGHSMALTLPCTRGIGVDPEPRIRCTLDPSTLVETTTSDAFFAAHEPADLFGGLPVDLVFLDGLHLSEFVLRDFINAERFASPDSVILIHDVLPPSEEVASRTQAPEVWAGDVWKLIPVLREYRPDLIVRVVDVPPTGLAMVTGLDPGSTSLTRSYDRVVERMNSLSFGTHQADPIGTMNVVPDDWSIVARELPRPFQEGDVRILRLKRALRLPPHLREVPSEARRRVALSRLGPPLRRLRSLLAGSRT